MKLCYGHVWHLYLSKCIPQKNQKEGKILVRSKIAQRYAILFYMTDHAPQLHDIFSWKGIFEFHIKISI